jgi:hypothetical protein
VLLRRDTGFATPGRRSESFLAIRQPFAKDDNVASLIAFLCGHHGEDINGSALPIDGAWIADDGCTPDGLSAGPMLT